jgi:hypothetical protein
MHVYNGRCHCGDVRFEVRKPSPINFVIDCNCSICQIKGILHHPVHDDELTISAGEDCLGLYQFKSNIAKHWFCQRCGIHTFARPRNDPSRYTVNTRCLDDFVALSALVEIRKFDGKNHPKDDLGKV